MLVCNDGDFPKFSVDDEGFMPRCLVIPMRSKFVSPGSENEHELQEEHTFRCDPLINDKFESWRSALLDILVDHYQRCPVLSQPETAKDWRDEVSSSANPLEDFLTKHVEITGNNVDDAVSRDEVWEIYLSTIRFLPRQQQLTARRFNKLYKSYFETKPGVKFISRTLHKGLHSSAQHSRQRAPMIAVHST